MVERRRHIHVQSTFHFLGKTTKGVSKQDFSETTLRRNNQSLKGHGQLMHMHKPLDTIS